MASRSGMLAAVAGVVVAMATLGATPAAAQQSDPAFTVDAQALDDALDCVEFTHPEREPVLLVHGTFTRGHEQFDWNYGLTLPERGFDHCIVTYPDRGLGDMQISAEYVAHAVMTIAAETGRQVDVVGHSQGGLVPRWAIKYWPSVRASVDDFVGLASPNHGTTFRDFGGQDSPAPMPAVFWQFRSDSTFMRTLNDGDETPGDIDYTQIYTLFDELVQPAFPEPTAALDLGSEDEHVANILLQDVCPGRLTDHLTIGTTDVATLELVLDAFVHDGPADPGRAGLGATCSLPDQILDPAQADRFAGIIETGLAQGLPEMHLADSEPALMPYARSGDTTDDTAGTPSDGAPDAAPAPIEDATPALPATGGGAAVAGILALGASIAARRRR